MLQSQYRSYQYPNQDRFSLPLLYPHYQSPPNTSQRATPPPEAPPVLPTPNPTPSFKGERMNASTTTWSAIPSSMCMPKHCNEVSQSLRRPRAHMWQVPHPFRGTTATFWPGEILVTDGGAET